MFNVFRKFIKPKERITKKEKTIDFLYGFLGTFLITITLNIVDWVLRQFYINNIVRIVITIIFTLILLSEFLSASTKNRKYIAKGIRIYLYFAFVSAIVSVIVLYIKNSR